MRPAFLVTFFVAIAIVTAREVLQLRRIPKPTSYWDAVWIWAILGLVADVGLPEVSVAFAVGLVIAMAYNYYKGKDALNITGSQPATPGTSGQSGFGPGGAAGAGAGGGGGGSF